jgi:PcfJ-like protein
MSRRASEQQSVRRPLFITFAIVQGNFARADYPGPPIFAANCRQLSRAYAQSRERVRLLPAARLFDVVERRSRILHDLPRARYKVVPYLIDLAARSGAWQRQPEAFSPRSRHGREQLAELVQHLFEFYRVPAWLRAALGPRRGRPARSPAFGWYVHLAQGRNLRTAPDLPLQLSRRAAHEALTAPATSSPQQALLYGYLRGHDAPRAVLRELLLVARAGSFDWDETRLKLWEKLARAPRLRAEQVQPLLHYAERCRTEGASLDVPVRVLLCGMERWHALLRDAATRRRALQFGPQFYERWASRLPCVALEGRCEEGDYALTELRSFHELFEEGQLMHHCVFSYAHAARAGAVSIWSLRLTRAGREVSRVTVRVMTKERVLAEARRRFNAAIEPHERRLLHTWASRQGLEVAPGV